MRSRIYHVKTFNGQFSLCRLSNAEIEKKKINIDEEAILEKWTMEHSCRRLIRFRSPNKLFECILALKNNANELQMSELAFEYTRTAFTQLNRIDAIAA